jgi:hypothetical protein
LRFFPGKYAPLRGKWLSIFIALLLFRFAEAQVFFSTDKNYLKSKTEQNNLLTNFKSNYPDTSINSLHQYMPRNFMGNIGLPSPNYILGYGTDDLGFRLYNVPSPSDRFYSRQVRYCSTKGPYASLTGIAGEKQLQQFNMQYTQSFRERFNINLMFKRYTSLGYYLKQQTYTNNFYASSNYVTKRKNAGFYFYVLNNGNKNEENGGIKDVVLSDKTLRENKDLLLVRLSKATRDNRELKLMFNPWFRLGGSADSVPGFQHFLQLKSTLTNSSYKYKDPAAGADKYYTNYYFDKDTTLDSTHVRQYGNEIYYTLKHSSGNFGLSAGYKNEINKVWQKKDSLFMNHVLQGDIYFSDKLGSRQDSLNRPGFDEKLSVQYVVNGPNSGNYKLESNYTYWLNREKRNGIFLDALAENRSADFRYNYWNSNHFQWLNNAYKTQQTAEVRAGLKLKSLFSFTFFYQNLFRYLYFDRSALPQQYNKTIDNFGLSVHVSKVFFKHLGVYLEHTYQESSRPAYVRLPGNVTTARLFYNGHLFKNALHLQLGSQVQVYQSFRGYAYMPSTQAFYLQDTYATAACPFLDVYLNARIRPVSIFIKMENALQGLVGYNYSFVPGYFQTDRALRFGINWVFFD